MLPFSKNTFGRHATDLSSPPRYKRIQSLSDFGQRIFFNFVGFSARPSFELFTAVTFCYR